MQRMIGGTEARAALAVLLLLATGGSPAAQEFAGREKLRAHSNEFRKDINAGTGLQFGRRQAPTGYLPPTRTFRGERLEIMIASVRLVLLHTPGEIAST